MFSFGVCSSLLHILIQVVFLLICGSTTFILDMTHLSDINIAIIFPNLSFKYIDRKNVSFYVLLPIFVKMFSNILFKRFAVLAAKSMTIST
jgi:hypothetical protein